MSHRRTVAAGGGARDDARNLCKLMAEMNFRVERETPSLASHELTWEVFARPNFGLVSSILKWLVRLSYELYTRQHTASSDVDELASSYKCVMRFSADERSTTSRRKESSGGGGGVGGKSGTGKSEPQSLQTRQARFLREANKLLRCVLRLDAGLDLDRVRRADLSSCGELLRAARRLHARRRSIIVDGGSVGGGDDFAVAHETSARDSTRLEDARGARTIKPASVAAQGAKRQTAKPASTAVQGQRRNNHRRDSQPAIDASLQSISSSEQQQRNPSDERANHDHCSAEQQVACALADELLKLAVAQQLEPTLTSMLEATDCRISLLADALVAARSQVEARTQELRALRRQLDSEQDNKNSSDEAEDDVDDAADDDDELESVYCERLQRARGSTQADVDEKVLQQQQRRQQEDNQLELANPSLFASDDEPPATADDEDEAELPGRTGLPEAVGLARLLESELDGASKPKSASLGVTGPAGAGAAAAGDAVGLYAAGLEREGGTIGRRTSVVVIGTTGSTDSDDAAAADDDDDDAGREIDGLLREFVDDQEGTDADGSSYDGDDAAEGLSDENTGLAGGNSVGGRSANPAGGS